MFTQMLLVMYKHAHYCLVRELNKYGGVCGLQMYNMHAELPVFTVFCLARHCELLHPLWTGKLCRILLQNCTAPLGSMKGREFRDLMSDFQLLKDLTYAAVLGNSLVRNRKVKVRR